MKAKKTKKAAQPAETLPAPETDLPESAAAAPEAAEPTTATEPPTTTADNKLKRFFAAYWQKKLWTLPLTVLFVVGILLAIPLTRYPILGNFVQRIYAVSVVDATTHKPITSADILLDGKRAKTDNKGQAKLTAKMGSKQLTVIKRYYKAASSEIFIGISRQKSSQKITLTATGRQVPIVVFDKISNVPLANAKVTASGTEVKTDKEGKAIIVLPADKTSVTSAISLNGYNQLSSKVVVTEQAVKENSFYLTAAGKIYFLSKQSGKIDVVSTNLDGSERKTVVAGTGKEDQYDTILLASRDWKYLALKSKRDGGEQAKLFLIETATDKLTTMDEGNAYFTMTGWSDHRFVYQVNRQKQNPWDPKAQALKTYDAASGKLSTLDETEAEGGPGDYAYQYFNGVYILNNEIVYTKNWSAWFYYGSNGRLNGKTVGLLSVRPDGTNKKSIKDFPSKPGNSYIGIDLLAYAPGEIYVSATDPNQNKQVIYEYEDGKIEEFKDESNNPFGKEYPTYLESPSSKQVFWSEARDGKNALFVGNSDAENPKQIATLSEYVSYGWFTDQYLLVTKKGSELYIMPAAGGEPLKISDYHKPSTDFRGYGKGYGGL